MFLLGLFASLTLLITTRTQTLNAQFLHTKDIKIPHAKYFKYYATLIFLLFISAEESL